MSHLRLLTPESPCYLGVSASQRCLPPEDMSHLIFQLRRTLFPSSLPQFFRLFPCLSHPWDCLILVIPFFYEDGLYLCLPHT